MPTYWWVCHLCSDRMTSSTDRAQVERDRNAHLKNSHPDRRPSFNDSTLSSWDFATAR